MKTVRILESCLVNGHHAEAGSIIPDLHAVVIADLIANGRAVVVSDPEPIVTRDPEPQHRDPAPAKKAKAK